MNKVTFLVEGLNVEKLAHNLISLGIPVAITRENAKQFRLTVPFKYRQQSIDYLTKKCYNIKNIEIQGFGKIKTFLVKNVAISVAIVILLTMLLGMPCFYLQLKCTGAVAFEMVQSVLDESGISLGAFMWTIDTKKVEATLSRKLDLAYCFVEKKGCTLCIETVAKTTVDPPLDFTQSRDVVANFDGEITKMVVIQGTPQVAVGDKVKAGQLLVLGKTTFFDGTMQDVYALATIWAKVCVEVFCPYQQQITTFERTGKTFVATRLIIGKLILEKPCPFDSFDEESLVVQTFPFAITIEKITYYCTKQVVVLPTRQEYQQQAQNSALLEATKKLGCNPQSVQYLYGQDGVTVLAYAEIQITPEN